MLIGIEYKDGRVKEFDPNAYTSNEAMVGVDRSAKNAVTEFDLRLDRLEEDGLRLNIFWHDTTKKKSTVTLDGVLNENGQLAEIDVASRRPGCTIMVANKSALEQISSIRVHYAGGGEQVAWRQGSGDWLIKGTLFNAQRVLSYTDATTTSINAQAVSVFRYLRAAHPTLSDAEICEMMGYPEEAYREIRAEESAQVIAESRGHLPVADGALPEDDAEPSADTASAPQTATDQAMADAVGSPEMSYASVLSGDEPDDYAAAIAGADDDDYDDDDDDE